MEDWYQENVRIQEEYGIYSQSQISRGPSEKVQLMQNSITGVDEFQDMQWNLYDIGFFG